MGVLRPMLAVLLLSTVAACSDPVDPPGRPEPPEVPAVPAVDSLLAGLDMAAAVARITAADIGAHVGALADDSMKGRLTGRPEIEQAAAYIAHALEGSGLEPAGREGYLDRWEFAGGTEGDSLSGLPPNVVAVLPGSDPALEGTYVVVTAHFDHVGVRPPEDGAGDSIFNGADDNASGTAALLEVADALAALPEAPRRSVLFLAVSGEEWGLLGSFAYMASPSVPRGGMVANINLDMVGRGPADTTYAVGHLYSSLGPLAEAVAADVPAVGLVVEGGQPDLMFRSDHFAFARARIPALGLFAGFHADYHTPADEPGMVDSGKAAAVARLAAYLAAAVAEWDEAPAWTAVGTQALAPYW